MKQATFASLSVDAKKKHTRREVFLGDMDRVVPWAAWMLGNDRRICAGARLFARGYSQCVAGADRVWSTNLRKIVQKNHPV